MSALGEPVTVVRPHLQWSAIFAGAVTAAGAAATLQAFGAGIGLSVMSSAPTWRDSSAVLWLVAGVFLLLVAVASFAVGGYIAGRMRAPLNLDTAETEFRDGMHGLVTWGLAVLMSAVLALGVAFTASLNMPGASSAMPGASSAGETLLASELDNLFRTGRVIDDLSYRRAEAARILLTASSHNGVSNPDRRYLTTITSIVMGVPDAEAKARVDDAINASKQALHRARIAAVLQAFFIAAALFVGAAVAWHAATEGGKDREVGAYQFWEWRRRR
jgi:hypothetical protein